VRSCTSGSVPGNAARVGGRGRCRCYDQRHRAPGRSGRHLSSAGGRLPADEHRTRGDAAGQALRRGCSRTIPLGAPTRGSGSTAVRTGSAPFASSVMCRPQTLPKEPEKRSRLRRSSRICLLIGLDFGSHPAGCDPGGHPNPRARREAISSMSTGGRPSGRRRGRRL